MNPLILLVALAQTAPAVKQAARPAVQGPVAPDDVRLQKLPPTLREQGRLILAESDEDKRADLAEALAGKDAIGAHRAEERPR